MDMQAGQFKETPWETEVRGMLQHSEAVTDTEDFPTLPAGSIETMEMETPGEGHGAFRGMLTAVLASAVFWLSLFSLAGLLL